MLRVCANVASLVEVCKINIHLTLSFTLENVFHALQVSSTVKERRSLRFAVLRRRCVGYEIGVEQVFSMYSFCCRYSQHTVLWPFEFGGFNM